MNKKDTLNSIKKIEGIESKHNELETKHDSFESTITSKVNGVETKVNGIETKHDEFETSITTKVNGVEGRVTTLETNIENSASSSDLSNLTTKVNTLEEKHNTFETSITAKVEGIESKHNELETKHDEFETSITTKVNGVDDALRHLGGDDYIAIEDEEMSLKLLAGLTQLNNNFSFKNDLDAKVPNGEITRREQITNIFSVAFMIGMAIGEGEEGGEEAIQEMLPTLAELYAMENGSDHDDWGLVFKQLHVEPTPEIYVKDLTIGFNRSTKIINLYLTLYIMEAVDYELHIKANYETNEIIELNPFEAGIIYFLSTSNEFEYEPEGDYNPATKKYVDDKMTVPIVRGNLIHQVQGENTTTTIENIGNLSRKVNLGTATKQNIILNFKYTKPSDMPTINSDDLVEVSVEAFLYVNEGLSNVTTQYNFYEDGVLQDGSVYLFQNGEQPTLEAGHRYQIFISYYINDAKVVRFATVGLIDFGTVSNSEPAPAGN